MDKQNKEAVDLKNEKERDLASLGKTLLLRTRSASAKLEKLQAEFKELNREKENIASRVEDMAQQLALVTACTNDRNQAEAYRVAPPGGIPLMGITQEIEENAKQRCDNFGKILQ